ncbi:MAG: U32 family peptidase, partial [Planctomycetota bacterium]|nr:U32 family peptidase [Planctomycetota bacterium]
RTMEQLRGVLEWPGGVGMVYCDFEDVRRYREAVEMARGAGLAVGLATLRVVKPAEEGLLKQIADCGADAVLVRNLAAVSFYAERGVPMIGDYSLNVANELTAGVMAEAGVRRMVPSYDLNWQQMAAMLGRVPVELFEVVVHQHMPMFHMEHCVFAHTLSNGKDCRDCGRPCDRHRVDLRDRVGMAHPLLPDVGCRNTLFNAAAQSAAEYVPEMKRLGVKWYRVEMLRESGEEVGRLLEEYAKILAGVEEGKQAIRKLRALNQLGVTRGTLDWV